MVTQDGDATTSQSATTSSNDVPETSLLTYPHLRGVSLAFVLMGIMMHTIDSTIANVALPHMQGALSASVDQISWVITGYIVAAAIATPPVAWLSARFGIKTVLLASVASFTAASVLCGLAVTLQDMVAYRVLQGLSGAALIPVGQTIVLSAFKTEDYGKAMGMFGFGVMFGPIIGPTLGGYITEWANWRWVFFVNLPFGLAALTGIWIFVKDTPVDKGHRLDGIGLASLVIAMAAFQILMDRGHGQDWFSSWEITLWAAAAVTSLYIFITHTFTSEAPLFDRRLFTDRNFAVGNVVFFFVGGNMVAVMLMIPAIMQTLLGYPVDTTGLLLAPRGIGMMVGMALIPRLTTGRDPRVVISIGLLITAYALWDQAQMGTYFSAWGFVRTGIMHGTGLGIIFVSLGAMTFSHLPDEIRLQASTFFNMVRNVGQSFCAAVAMSALARNIQINTSELGEAVTRVNKSLRLALADMPTMAAQDQALGVMQGGILKQAMFISYINNFYILAVITILFIPIVWLARNNTSTIIKNTRTPHTP